MFWLAEAEMQSPAWVNITVVGGILTIATTLVYLLRDNTSKLWAEVGSLKEQNKHQAGELKDLHAEIKQLRGQVDQLDDANVALKHEVDDLCDELNQPRRYFPRPDKKGPLRVQT